MELSDKKSIQHIVSCLAKLGLREVVICPGSRSAPLVISFNRHPSFSCTSIRDERSAAFFALGKSIELNEPVAVICTSGSAALNFAPAISEAYYQRIPLIVLTADRPKEWTGQGDGQTIDQTNLYKNFIRQSYDLDGDATAASDLWYNQRCLSEGWNIATVSNRGPVHFNIPLSEPLYGIEEADEVETKIFTEEKTEKNLSNDTLDILSREFHECNKVMVLAGQQLPDHRFQTELSKLAAYENVIVLTESTSNIHDDLFVENIDRCITGMSEAASKELMPELLITVGGAVVSKRIKALLRKHRPKHHWNIDPFDSSMDTYQSLTRAVPMLPSAFFFQLRQRLNPASSQFRKKWLERKERMNRLHLEFCNHCDYSDLRFFHEFYKDFPAQAYLHLANSSPVRYAQLFDNSGIAASWSNRGTSGIDGCTSTAVGAAVASPGKQFVLVTGDVAFYYDINGLWNDESFENLKIVLINNGGGGIFRIISGPDKVDELEKFFETSMQSKAEKIAAHFGWQYLSANDNCTLQHALSRFFNPDCKKVILEVFTNAENNALVLDKYWQFLKENQNEHE